MKNETQTEVALKDYVIKVPGSAGSYARHDFQSYEWESTDYLTQAWTVEAANEKQAVEKFHKAFNIALTDYFTATPLLEAINTKLSFYRAF